MLEVITTDEFREWWKGLDEGDSAAVYRMVTMLESKGVGLGHPQSSAVRGSRYAMRELRVQSGGRPIRIFYAFDPKRQAVLILGGSKEGDDRFYERMIPYAERLWEGYLAEIEAEGEEDKG